MSVVIPCYNAAAFLADAVESVRAQTSPVAEVLVVDDASTDDTVAVAERLGVTVIRQPENRGPSGARNAGIARAAGDVVAFLDADDAWLPWHVELAVDVLARHPEVAVVGTGHMPYDEPLPSRPASPAVVEIPPDPVVTLLERTLIPQTGAVARRSALLEVGGYEDGRRYAEDYDVWLRIAARHPLARLDAVSVRYRQHPGQASWASRRMLESGFELRLRELAAIQASGDPERAARAAAGVARSLDQELSDRWYWRDPASFVYLLDLARAVPGTERLRRRWALKRRFTWHLWHAARAVKRRVRPRPNET